MKKYSILLIVTALLPATLLSQENINRKVLEILLETTNQKLVQDSPVIMEVQNVFCNVSNDRKIGPACSAFFQTTDGSELKPIKRSDQFFSALRSKNAISLEEKLLNSTNYRAHKLSCSYTAFEKSYYSCSSDITVTF